MKTTICHWCDDAPVAENNQWSCEDCTFRCPDCEQHLPLEVGHGDCQACDECCFNHKEAHIPY